VVLPAATRNRLRDAVDGVKQRLEGERRPGIRGELFFYYSGHSDEDGLLLGGDKVPYRDLRQWIASAGDVRIVVLDSCASGALIRQKGGQHRPAFLSDASTQARGHAFLTASSADEAAQESDGIGAAFFTHYLLSGLRGAADANRDRRVTLNEAYQFAYAETLQRTESSRAGVQHAAYDIQLAGTGDLVMTDLRAPAARLVLGREIAGRLYVRDGEGRLIAELRKEPIYPVELGLEPGTYRIVLDADGRPLGAAVTLSEGGRHELSRAGFEALPPQALVATRGGAPSSQLADAWSPGAGAPYRTVPFDLVLVPGVRLIGRGPDPVLHKFALGVIAHSDAVRGVQAGILGSVIRDDLRGVQLSPAFNLIYGRTRGAQIGANANVAMGELRGVQLGAGNLAWSGGAGAQVGPVNVSGKLWSGAQVGVVNVGGATRGAQVGVVNIAGEFTGAQIGVVNVARRGRGLSLGILPLVLEGENRVQVWASDVALTNVGVKLGTRQFYTLWALGLDSGVREGVDRRAAGTFGLGAHVVPSGRRFFADLDATITAFWSSTDLDQRDTLLASARLVVGWQLLPRLALTAGPTFNVNTGWGGQDDRPGLGFLEVVRREGDTTVRLFPGFVIGVQL
jgi:hypothetical protein